jgi:organic hydroperoxide reductase OsmC/OhrA
VGASPEDFLIAAVTACYSGTLMRVLTQKNLPADALTIQAAGVVENYPEKARFARITVSPVIKVIKGGIASKRDEYQTAAEEARDLCFIGKTVRDYLQYEVGTVTIG